MNNIIKFLGGTLLLATAAAMVAGIVMSKNGTLDEFIDKFKKNQKTSPIDNDRKFCKKIQMIATNHHCSDMDLKNEFFKNPNTQTHYNGNH